MALVFLGFCFFFFDFALKCSFLSGAVATSPGFFGVVGLETKTELHLLCTDAIQQIGGRLRIA